MFGRYVVLWLAASTAITGSGASTIPTSAFSGSGSGELVFLGSGASTVATSAFSGSGSGTAPAAATSSGGGPAPKVGGWYRWWRQETAREGAGASSLVLGTRSSGRGAVLAPQAAVRESRISGRGASELAPAVGRGSGRLFTPEETRVIRARNRAEEDELLPVLMYVLLQGEED